MTLSLEQHLAGHQRANTLDPALATVLRTLAVTCVRICAAVRKGALGGVLGSAGSGNVQGEEQKKLDVIANDLMLQGNAWSGALASMASEEMEHAHPTGFDRAPYLLLFDPLDGSSNIDVNASIGTIFSVLRTPAGVDPASDAAFLQAGHAQVAAGYCVYGPQATLVLTFGHGVQQFTLDPATQEFMLVDAAMRIAPHAAEFAINMSNQRHWAAPVQRYVAEMLAGTTGPRGKDFNMRWMGAMVADAHRVLTRSGVFMYPHDAREPSKPGKLRLLYEANPIAWLVEQAGGAASDGRRRILDIVPRSLHERVALFFGSREEIDVITRYHA